MALSNSWGNSSSPTSYCKQCTTVNECQICWPQQVNSYFNIQWQKNGTKIPLDEEHGIDFLGHLVASTLGSINRKYYGNLHSYAHVIAGRIADVKYKHMVRGPYFLGGKPLTWRFQLEYFSASWRNSLNSLVSSSMESPFNCVHEPCTICPLAWGPSYFGLMREHHRKPQRNKRFSIAGR